MKILGAVVALVLLGSSHASAVTAGTHSIYAIAFGEPNARITGTLETFAPGDSQCISGGCAVYAWTIRSWSFTGFDGVNTRTISSNDPNAFSVAAGPLVDVKGNLFFNFSDPQTDRVEFGIQTTPNNSNRLLEFTGPWYPDFLRRYWFLFGDEMEILVIQNSNLQIGTLVSRDVVTPLPAGLPLFATGLGILFLFRKRRIKCG